MKRCTALFLFAVAACATHHSDSSATAVSVIGTCALKSVNGSYLVAEKGGGGAVNRKRAVTP